MFGMTHMWTFILVAVKVLKDHKTTVLYYTTENEYVQVHSCNIVCTIIVFLKPKIIMVDQPQNILELRDHPVTQESLGHPRNTGLTDHLVTRETLERPRDT